MPKKHRSDNTSGGDIIFEGVAGESINEGQGVAFDEANDEYILIDNATPPYIHWGIALEDAGVGKTLSVLFFGVESFEAPSGGVTMGQEIFVSLTNSNLTTTATGNFHAGYALETSAATDDFLLHVDNAGVGITGGVEEILASSTENYINTIGTASVEITWTSEVVGIQVENDSASATVAIRFDATDAAIPSNSGTLTPNNLVRQKEKQFWAVRNTVCNIIASAASTQVRVTGWRE